ncbi:unnamed protein product, partial [Musa textilis]
MLIPGFLVRGKVRRDHGGEGFRASDIGAATARVLLCLGEMGAEYELVPVDFFTREQKSPHHLARNAFGLVPVLEDGDLLLFESRAIARYVLRKYKSSGPDLVREGSLEESAMVDLWLEVEAQQYEKGILPIFFQIMVVPVLYGGVPDEKLVADGVEKLVKVLDVYEARLSQSKHLAVDFVSLADLSHVPFAHYIMATPCASLFQSRPHAKAWWDSLASRPACKKVTAALLT